MLKLVGILLLVNSFAVACWAVGQDKFTKSASTLCAFALFVALSLIFNERATELSFGSVAKLKISSEQAQADAQAIADLLMSP